MSMGSGMLPPGGAGWLAQLFEGFGWRDVADIAVVTLVLSYLLRVVRDTRALQMLRGLVIVLIVAFITRKLSLTTTTWLLQGLSVVWLIGAVIVFQPELRRLVTGLGEPRWIKSLFPTQRGIYHEIARSAQLMSKFKMGGLIIVEREASLAEFAESGTRVDANVNAELLAAIFTPPGPLHDGAVIIREGRLYAAGCTLPLSQTKSEIQSLGMRHRAALGITEETDAVAVVISEETNKISMSVRGQLTPPLDAETVEGMLADQTGRRRTD